MTVKTHNIGRLEISPEPTRDGICFLVSQDLLDIKFGTQGSQDFDFHTNLNPHSRVNFLVELPSDPWQNSLPVMKKLPSASMARFHPGASLLLTSQMSDDPLPPSASRVAIQLSTSPRF
jgi:hypothetical protein